MGINEALDNLYVCATNAKSETLEEGYYEKCYDRVIEELNQKDEVEADLYESNNRITDLLLILGDRDRMINKMAEFLIGFLVFNYNGEFETTLKDKEDVIKYFEERCKNAKD